MKVDIFQEGSKYNVTLEGRIDTNTAEQFQKEITPLMEAKGAEIVIDCKDMTYTSSQGLRIFLMLQKCVTASQGSLLLTNMSPVVKEVFDITGFSSIIKIQ